MPLPDRPLGDSPRPGSRFDEWIQFINGGRYDFGGAHDLQGLTREDVARSLSQINRFRGATLFPVNVAQHSLLVSQLAGAIAPTPYKTEAAIYGLLHDAHEMVISDIPSPVKRKFFRDDAAKAALKIEEGHADRAIWEVFGVSWPMPDTVIDFVKLADLIALSTERRDAMAPSRHPWQELPPPSKLHVVRRENPEWSAAAFVSRFNRLKVRTP